MRQLWRLAGEPRWVDRRPEGAAARRRALAPPREPLEGPAQGQAGDTSSGDSSTLSPEERAGVVAIPQSSMVSADEGAVGQGEAPAEATQEAVKTARVDAPDWPG
uniref:Uncharacterized protein n=1 Tax=Sphaerodactylus townsendi TaxID=933632 RepID=A0ACB8EUZ9_9SAUR